MPLLTVTNRPHRRVTPATDPLNNSVLSLSPVAWWKADEASGSTMLDYSGNGFHATYNTGSGFLSYRNTALRAGSAGCIGMSGLSYAAQVVPTGLLAAVGQIYPGDSWTIVAFLNKTGGGSVLAKAFGWGVGNVGSENGPNVMYRGAGGTARGEYSTGGAEIISPNNTAGTVIMLAATKDASGNCVLYENGTSVGTATYGGVRPANPSPIQFLGTSGGVTAQYGYIGFGSDFIVYNVALNSTQLTAIAHAGGLV